MGCGGWGLDEVEELYVSAHPVFPSPSDTEPLKVTTHFAHQYHCLEIIACFCLAVVGANPWTMYSLLRGNGLAAAVVCFLMLQAEACRAYRHKHILNNRYMHYTPAVIIMMAFARVSYEL